MRNDMPTATEFIPAEENGVGDEGSGVQFHQATGDKRMEMIDGEPYDDTVPDHIYICDECGHSETLETDMGHHLHYEHYRNK